MYDWIGWTLAVVGVFAVALVWCSVRAGHIDGDEVGGDARDLRGSSDSTGLFV